MAVIRISTRKLAEGRFGWTAHKQSAEMRSLPCTARLLWHRASHPGAARSKGSREELGLQRHFPVASLTGMGLSLAR